MGRTDWVRTLGCPKPLWLSVAGVDAANEGYHLFNGQRISAAAIFHDNDRYLHSNRGEVMSILEVLY